MTEDTSQYLVPKEGFKTSVQVLAIKEKADPWLWKTRYQYIYKVLLKKEENARDKKQPWIKIQQ